jgi:hypothetical protein
MSTTKRQDLIVLMEKRILAEHRKHSLSQPNPNEWAKLAAAKIATELSDRELINLID